MEEDEMAHVARKQYKEMCIRFWFRSLNEAEPSLEMWTRWVRQIAVNTTGRCYSFNLATCSGHLPGTVRSKHKAITLASCAESNLFPLEIEQPQDLSEEGRTADVLCERVDWIGFT